MSAIQTWNEMVRLEHEQSDRIRGQRPTDSWATAAQNFKQDPFRTDDAVVEALRSRLVPGETLLDIGGGGGRLALPLALTCSAVAAVEPSPSMCAVFRETADEFDIRNVSLIESDWLSAAVEPADVVLCCNVLYVISDIGTFVRSLDSHAQAPGAGHIDADSSPVAGASHLGGGAWRATAPNAHRAAAPARS